MVAKLVLKILMLSFSLSCASTDQDQDTEQLDQLDSDTNQADQGDASDQDNYDDQYSENSQGSVQTSDPGSDSYTLNNGSANQPYSNNTVTNPNDEIFDASTAEPFNEGAPENGNEPSNEPYGTNPIQGENAPANTSVEVAPPPVNSVEAAPSEPKPPIPQPYRQATSQDEQLVGDTIEPIAPTRPSLDLLPISKTLWWVGFDYRPNDAVVRIELVTKGEPRYTLTLLRNMAFQYELVVRLYETKIRRKVRRAIDTSEFASPIAHIRMEENFEEDATDVVITLREKVNPRVYVKRGNVLLTFPIPEKYFGNEGVESSAPQTAQVLNDHPISVALLEGSEPPFNPNLPDEYDPSIAAFGTEVDPEAGEEVEIDSINENPDDLALNAEVPANIPENYTGNIGEVPPTPSPASTNSNYNQQYYNQQNNNTQYNNQSGNQQYNNQQYDNQQYNNQNQQYDNQQYNDDIESGLDNFEDQESGEGNDFDVRHTPELEIHSRFTIMGVAQNSYDLEADSDYNAGGGNATTNAYSLDAGSSNNPNGGYNYNPGNTTGSNNPDAVSTSPNNSGTYNANLGNNGNAYGLDNTPTNNSAAVDAANPDSVPVAETPGVDDTNIYGDASDYNNPNQVLDSQQSNIDLSGTEIEGNENPEGVGSEGGSTEQKPISVEFRGARLKDVISVLAKENGTNFTYPQDVGMQEVNMRLENVHWTDALRAVLETYGLGYVELPGGVVRIDRIERLKQQNSEIQEARRRAALLIDTKILVIRLSYAKASEVATIVNGMLDRSLDARSKVTSDERTNSIMVEAIPQVLSKVKAIIERVDLQTPQVRIETRIVEVIKKTGNFLGVDWSGPIRYDTARGLGFSNLVFPNSLNSTYAIDTGSAGTPPRQGGRFDMHFGSLNDSVELDLRLRLEETRGNNKILQNSSLIVLDNQPAEIVAGKEDYIIGRNPDGTTSSVNISYNLSLKVTPKIAADSSIQMSIELESNQPDAAIAATANVATVGSQLKTILRRNNGETAVIGGIYTSNEEDKVVGVPFLSSIPIIGALFRSKGTTDTKRELVILLTPSIVNTKDASDTGLTSPTLVNAATTASDPGYGGGAGGYEGNSDGAYGYEGGNSQGYENDSNNYDSENQENIDQQNQGNYSENQQQGYGQQGQQNQYQNQGANQNYGDQEGGNYDY